jgi:hypothetical protein
MSRRTSIITAIAEKLKTITISNGYNTDLYENAYPKLVFWDECKNFPSLYLTPGSEQREYLPGDFKWGFLGVSIKVYCKGDDSNTQLELLLEDVERIIDANRDLVYDVANNLQTTEILVVGITTDEGLLAPYAVGEVNLQVRYQVL